MALVRSTLIAVCLVTAFFRIAVSDEAPVVTVKGGTLRGEYARVKGTEQVVEAFLGVPFASPPVGPLRFAKPQPALPWKGVRDATHQPNMCLQDSNFIRLTAEALHFNHTIPPASEDCLYLNVYAPSNLTAGEKAPVMVWIHGGGLMMGCAAQYDGAVLAAYQGVVVVVIQYRLAILGFFSTGDEHAPGNWGFFDQLAALQWVQDNIESFGGDPKSVTIFGESAGGISASILMLSPLSTGLFHKAILQSGVATVGSFSQAKLHSVANLAGCSHNATEQQVQCLRQKTVEDILNATANLKVFLWGVVDGVFLKKTSEELLKNKEFLRVPVLMGATDDEFGWLLPMTFSPPSWDKGMDKQTVMKTMNFFFPNVAANELIAQEYLRDAQTPEAIRDGFTEMMGDRFMVLPIIKVAKYYRDAGVPVYLYEFQHRPEAHKSRPSFVKADHASDVGFVFGACFFEGSVTVTGNITTEEDELCRTTMEYWANFARTGSPNGAGLVQWPVYGETEEYLKLDLTQSVGQKLRQNRVHFMDVVLPQLLAKLPPSPDAP
ncbi:carboxylesterase 3 [Conger conger]|uniref:carboxylesterase 3 n=1 Tax=Conger conger TaxID=82655 RepID=UPI002A59E61C|nr:carboxylesterase 3 [Conger conger]XP_061103129.1 carboxylesterase 3 [Conger conger]XP_061103130.1 carboxylesterase 3 [Conger conger]